MGAEAGAESAACMIYRFRYSCRSCLSSNTHVFYTQGRLVFCVWLHPDQAVKREVPSLETMLQIQFCNIRPFG